jgi:hypothetical protein
MKINSLAPKLKAILIANRVNCLHSVSSEGCVGFRRSVSSFTISISLFLILGIRVMIAMLL